MKKNVVYGIVAPPVYTPEQEAEYARRAAQRFEVGDRVVAIGSGGGLATVVAVLHEVPDAHVYWYIGWLYRLLGHAKPERQWSYKIVFDGEVEQPGGPWYSPSLLMMLPKEEP